MKTKQSKKVKRRGVVLNSKVVLLAIVMINFFSLISCQKEDINESISAEDSKFDISDAKKVNTQNSYSLLAPNGKYVSNEGELIRATVKELGAWERFYFEEENSWTIRIKTVDGMYLKSSTDGKSLVATSKDKKDADFFFYHKNSSTTASGFQLFNMDKSVFYKLASNGSGILEATTITDASNFVLRKYKEHHNDVIRTNTKYSLQSSTNSKYVSSENGKIPVSVNRNAARSWEKLNFIETESKKLYIQASSGKYLRAVPHNGKIVLRFSANTFREADIFKRTYITRFNKFLLSNTENDVYYKVSSNGTAIEAIKGTSNAEVFISKQIN